MGNCGCGGKCGDCKKIKAKELKKGFCDPHYTGDLKYDGTEFTCETDQEITLETDENLNSIILAFAQKLCEHGVSITDLEAALESFTTEVTNISAGNNTNYAANNDLDNTVTAGNTFDTAAITVVTAGTYIINFGAIANVFGGAQFEAYIRKTTNTATDYKEGRQGSATNTEGTVEGVEMITLSNTLRVTFVANDQIVLRFKATGANIVALGYSITMFKVA